MNVELAEAFADACRAPGPEPKRSRWELAKASRRPRARATALEFLPAAASTRSAKGSRDARRSRGRVVRRAQCARRRPALSCARGGGRRLSRVGGAAGDALLDAVAPWMDGYFHAAAVLLAMARAPWLTSLHEAQTVCQRLDEAFALARDAHKGRREVARAQGAPQRARPRRARRRRPLRRTRRGPGGPGPPRRTPSCERSSSGSPTPADLPARVRADIDRISGALLGEQTPARHLTTITVRREIGAGAAGGGAEREHAGQP